MDPSKRLLFEKRAMRNYELARLRVASRVAIVVVPIVCVAMAISSQPTECACIGVLLLVGVMGMRWYGKGLDRIVVPGLVAGTIPMFAGLLKSKFPSANAEAACLVLCSVGFLSGAYLARSAFANSTASMKGWIAGVGVAAATALMGCIGGGLEAPFGVAIGGLFVALYYSMREGGSSTQS